MSTETDKLKKCIGLVEGGLVLLMEAVKAGDPPEEIIWRIQEELRLVRRHS